LIFVKFEGFSIKQHQRRHGLQVDSTEVWELFCEKVNVSTIWTVRVPYPTAEKSRRRGHADWASFVARIVVRRSEDSVRPNKAQWPKPTHSFHRPSLTLIAWCPKFISDLILYQSLSTSLHSGGKYLFLTQTKQAIAPQQRANATPHQTPSQLHKALHFQARAPTSRSRRPPGASTSPRSMPCTAGRPRPRPQHGSTAPNQTFLSAEPTPRILLHSWWNERQVRMHKSNQRVPSRSRPYVSHAASFFPPAHCIIASSAAPCCLVPVAFRWTTPAPNLCSRKAELPMRALDLGLVYFHLKT